MLARASRRRCRAFTSSLRVTTLKPPSRHSCQTGESRTPPSRRYVASTATSGCRSRSPSSAGVRSFRTQCLGAEVRLLDVLVLLQLLRVVCERDLARLEDVAAVRDVERHQGVLLDEQDRRALRDDLADPLDEDRREPHRRLIEQQQLRARHQRPADRHHLLLAARERSGLLCLALGEAREQLVNAVEILVDRLAVAAVGALEGANLEVLEHAQAREQPPAFRRLGDAPLDDVVGGGMRDVAALEANPSAPRAVEPVDRAERRRLAGAVRADQRHDLARLDLDRDALQRLDRAVVGVHILDLEDVLRLRVHAPDCPWSACLPRYASITRLSFCTSWGVPSAIFSP